MGAVRATAADPERFEATFREWETMANEAFTLIRANHPGAVKVFVSADALLAWCKAEGKVNNSTARAAFVQKLVSAGHVGAP